MRFWHQYFNISIYGPIDLAIYSFDKSIIDFDSLSLGSRLFRIDLLLVISSDFRRTSKKLQNRTKMKSESNFIVHFLVTIQWPFASALAIFWFYVCMCVHSFCAPFFLFRGQIWRLQSVYVLLVCLLCASNSI